MNSEKYPFFMRTVPSDAAQIEAIISFLRRKNWEYIQVVYSNSHENTLLFHHLTEVARQQDVCLITISKMLSGIHRDEAEYIVDTLMKHADTRAVVLLLDNSQIRSLFAAATDLNARGLFTWIGIRSWGDDMSVVEGYESIAEGAVTFSLEEETPIEFQQYYTTLKPENNNYKPVVS